MDAKGFAVKHWALSFPYIQDILCNAWVMGGGALKTAQVKEKEKNTHECSEIMLHSSVEMVSLDKAAIEWWHMRN